MHARAVPDSIHRCREVAVPVVVLATPCAWARAGARVEARVEPRRVEVARAAPAAAAAAWREGEA